MSSLFPLSRRETLLLLPLTLVGLGGIRYATTDAFPVSLEGPIAQAASVDMSNKVAVVTGANTGIGYETALRLAQEGATVVLAGIRKELVKVFEITNLDKLFEFLPDAESAAQKLSD